MSKPSPLAVVPVDSPANARFKALSDELLYAWDKSDANVLRQWSASTAATFGTSLKRRAVNLAKLVALLGSAAAGESTAAFQAYREDRLAHHVGSRAGAAYAASTELVARAKMATSQVAQLVRSHPREAVPQLLVLVVTSIVVSGGPDGDGGAPDLDLMFGIDAHRSFLSHSVLMGAALETGFLSLVTLVRLLHAQLPDDHDPLWDSIAQHADTVLQAANSGASLGLSYHLLVDGLVQPAAYHDLPVSLPMQAHQAVFVANGVAEALDAGNKPGGASAKPSSGQGHAGSGSPASVRSAHAPKVQPRVSKTARSVQGAEPTGPLPNQAAKPWWETASDAQLEAEKAAHARLRAQAFVCEPGIANALSGKELVLVERYGSWLQGLSDGALRPLSAAQERFAQAARGQTKPNSPYEKTWVLYLEVKRLMSEGRPETPQEKVRGWFLAESKRA